MRDGSAAVISHREQDLFGRGTLLAEVVRCRAPLLVLSGDSGIGKSALLRQAQLDAEDSLAPEPIEVYASDSAVQQAVLDALSSAVAMLLSEEPWRGQRVTVVDFLKRLLSRGTSEARRIVALALIGRVRERYGEATIEALGTVWHEARAASDAALAKRVASARDRNVAQELTALADELRNVSGRRHLIIALDCLEALPDGEVRVLSDVARIAPDGVLFRVAVMDTSPAGATVIRTLRAAADKSASFIQVSPLDAGGIREFLKAAHLDGALATEVLRLTGGYPLHAGDAVLHLSRGGALHDLTVNRDFGSVIDQGWADIEPSARQIARQLCLLERPLPLAALLDLLAVSDAEWWDAVDRLKTIRVFTHVVDEIPWFHEQRRRWLIDQLAEPELRAYAARIVPIVVGLVSEPTAWRYCPTLAALVEAAGNDVENNKLSAVAGLTREELAVAGALLELSERTEPAMDAQAALDHARHNFSVNGGLVEALHRLEELGLAVVRSNDRAAAAVPVFDAPLAATIAGFCQRRLGRMPIPMLASFIWGAVLGPLAAPFEFGTYGIGSPRPGTLANNLNVTQMRSTGIIGPGFYGCVAYGEHRSTQIYAVASTQRDQVKSLAEAWRGAHAEVGDGTFVVHDVVEYPSPRLRTQRWAIAADDLLGRDARFERDVGLELKDELHIAARIYQAARRRLTHDERLAAGLTEPMHLFFAEDDGHSTVVHVRGLSPGVTRIDDLGRWSFQDPYAFLRLAEALNLPNDASIDHMSFGGRVDRSHPLRKFAEEARARLLEYNRDQPRVDINLASGYLEQWLEPLLEERYQDALSMHNAVADEHLSVPTKLEVFIITSPVPEDSPIGTPPATVATRPSDRSRVNYALLDKPIEGWGHAELSSQFSLPANGSFSGYASVEDAIANLAGYDRDDVSAFRSLRELGLLRTQQ